MHESNLFQIHTLLCGIYMGIGAGFLYTVMDILSAYGKLVKKIIFGLFCTVLFMAVSWLLYEKMYLKIRIYPLAGVGMGIFAYKHFLEGYVLAVLGKCKRANRRFRQQCKAAINRKISPHKKELNTFFRRMNSVKKLPKSAKMFYNKYQPYFLSKKRRYHRERQDENAEI